MTANMGKKIPFGVSFLLIVGALIAVQTIWWKGLVAKPPDKGGVQATGGPAPKSNTQTIIHGREEVLVETFAGERAPGDSNGEGYAARLDRPTELAMDKEGNLLVCDTGNNSIRRIAPNGKTSVLAGGAAGNAEGTHAKFNAPCGIAVAEDGAIYVADTGNHSIRRILNGNVSTIFGDHSGEPLHQSSPQVVGAIYAMCMTPVGVAVKPGVNPSLLIADPGSSTLPTMSIDGGSLDYNGPSVKPSSVAYSHPANGGEAPIFGVAFPDTGDFRIGDKYFHEIPVEGGVGGGPIPRLKHPLVLCPFGRDWLISDSDHGALFLFRNGKAEVLAGFCSTGGPLRGVRDGTGASASFSTICGIAFDGKKYVYLSDTDNNMIRRLDVTNVLHPQPIKIPEGKR